MRKTPTKAPRQPARATRQPAPTQPAPRQLAQTQKLLQLPSLEEVTRREGKILNWNSEKGYGFIENEDKNVFCHISAIKNRQTGAPAEGDKAFFEVENSKGRAQAVRVTLIKNEKSLEASEGRN